jgi:formate dehydrogenase major subunit
VVSYDTPRGCTGAYYPETNPLVPLDATAHGSNQPAFKSVVVRLEPVAGGPLGPDDTADLVAATVGVHSAHGPDDKDSPQPHHLS